MAARGAGARARRDARLHGRVGAGHRRGLRRGAALRPRRPRRQPAARPRSRAGPELRDGVQVPSRSPALAAGERTLILAEGFSADRHYGKTMHGLLRYRREDVVTILDSVRAGEQEAGVPIVGDVDAASRSTRRSPSSAWQPRRALPSSPARAPPRLHRARARDRERAARDARRRSRASPARRSRRRRPPRPAPSAFGPRLPYRREPRGRRQDRAHGRLGLRDREDDGLARARPGSAGARDRLGLRPGRDRPGSRSRAGGWQSTRSSPTSSRALPSNSSSRAAAVGASCCSSRARVRLHTRRTPGSPSGSSTGRCRTPSSSAIAPARRRSKAPGHLIPPLAHLVELHEQASLPRRRARVVAVALNTAGLDDADARTAAEAAAATGLPTCDPVRDGADTLLDAVLDPSS